MLQAFMDWRNRLMIFEDVDVQTTIEAMVDGERREYRVRAEGLFAGEAVPFFAGGDQRRITAALVGTPVGNAVREGAVFGREFLAAVQSGRHAFGRVVVACPRNFDDGDAPVGAGDGIAAGVELYVRFSGLQHLGGHLADLRQRELAL